MSLTVTDPISDVAETPLIPTTSAGVIAPTEDVKLLGAVNGTITPVKTDPTPVVAETPDRDKLPDPNNKPGVPTDDVADWPVNPTAICVGDIAPTAVVATPLDATSTKTVVAFSPQFSNPHVSPPHPCSGKAVTLPTAVVNSPALPN